MIRIRTVTIFFIVLLVSACHREEVKLPLGQAPFLMHDSQRVDSLLAEMTLGEKVGELIYAQVDDPGESLLEEIVDGVALQQIGGLDLRGMPLERFLDWKDSLDALSTGPLFWGSQEEMLLNGQFADVETLPISTAIFALQNDTLLADVEGLHYDQLKALQMNWTSVPGEEQVASRRLQGLLDHHLLGVSSWSDYEDILRLDEPIPFDQTATATYRRQVANGVGGVRVPWHPIIEDSLRTRTGFLSWKLQQQTGFDGLIAGELMENADPVTFLQAGADQLIVYDGWSDVYFNIREAVLSGVLSEQELDHKVRKILMAKEWVEYPKNKRRKELDGPAVMRASFGPSFDPGNNLPASVSKVLQEHFRDPDWVVLKHALYHQSMVLLSNPEKRLPIDPSKLRGFRITQYAQHSFYDFKNQFEKYANYKSHLIKPGDQGRLKAFTPRTGRPWVNLILLDQEIDLERDVDFIESVKQAAKTEPLILINFGTPQNLQPFDTTMALIQIYERNEITEAMAVQLLFGALGAQGKLPTAINEYLPAGQGLSTYPTRMAYGIPQEVGIAPEKLVSIDAIMRSAIDDNIIPGGQILVAKEGKVIYSKAFGYHTFKHRQEVNADDLYDVASITKVAATTLAAMQLYDLGKYDLNDRLKNHLNLLPEATIKNIPIKKLLIHQSGLQSNMPIAPYVFIKEGPVVDCHRYYCEQQSDTFAIKVADNFYFNRFYQDSLWNKMQTLRLRSQTGYRYSDVNFMLVQRLIEANVKQPLDKWVNQSFYQPLGLRHSTFKPLTKFDPSQIVPTQFDRRWRNQLLTGYVHDESAALMGGVGGSAGLFTTAEDLAVIFQMLLNKGLYGGRRYLDAGTIELFTSAGHGNHRGLGFDKPGGRTKNPSYAKAASRKTFGHTGFTGTCVWADPEQDLIYIFLANRVYPNGSNRAFFKSNIRQKIHEVIYAALGTFDPQLPHLPDIRDMVVREG